MRYPIELSRLRREGPTAEPSSIARWLLATLNADLSEHERCAAESLVALRPTPGFAHPRMPARQHGEASSFEPSDLELATGWFPEVPAPRDDADADTLSAYAAAIARRVSKNAYRFLKKDRLDRAERGKLGIGHLTRRAYKQRFFLARRLRGALVAADALYSPHARHLNTVSFEGLLPRLSQEELEQDTRTAFMAVLHLACMRPSGVQRGEFSDDHAATSALHAAVLSACHDRATTTNWWALAHVMPATNVLGYLTDGGRGRLLGLWSAALVNEAGLLRTFWSKHAIDAGTMCMQRGVDPAAWNGMADRWERLRCGWMQAMHGCGLSDVLSTRYLGRVPRLRLRASAGPDADPDEDVPHRDAQVWGLLPRPWKVLLGDTACSASAVREACWRMELDPARSGWCIDLGVERSSRPSDTLLEALTSVCARASRWLNI